MQTALQRAHDVLVDYALTDCRLSPIVMGHINQTYRVDHARGVVILQRLSPIFSPLIHNTMEAITAHLASLGRITPRLIRSVDGKLWTTDTDGGIWRVMTFVSGRVVVQPKSATMCRSAGHLLGQFHRDIQDLAPDFSGARLGVHDTSRHLSGLIEALENHKDHEHYAAVSRLAEPVMRALEKIPRPTEVEDRIVHGDPKISNFVFDTEDRAQALIDLDTLARMPAPLELGDAFRSWCNPGGEGDGINSFRVDYFRAGLEGYARGARGLLTKIEEALVPDMISLITLELTVRFLRDALEESYFGWDQKRFARASEHNLLRAQSQWAIARAYDAVKDDARRQTEAVFRAHLAI